MRKPDTEIFHLALGVAQARPEQCFYFDDRIMIVNAAKRLGINAFHHQQFQTTKILFEELK